MKGVPCDIESVINIVSYCRVSKTVSICMCTTQCRNAFKGRYKQNVPKGGGVSSSDNCKRKLKLPKRFQN